MLDAPVCTILFHGRVHARCTCLRKEARNSLVDQDLIEHVTYRHMWTKRYELVYARNKHNQMVWQTRVFGLVTESMWWRFTRKLAVYKSVKSYTRLDVPVSLSLFLDEVQKAKKETISSSSMVPMGTTEGGQCVYMTRRQWHVSYFHCIGYSESIGEFINRCVGVVRDQQLKLEEVKSHTH